MILMSSLPVWARRALNLLMLFAVLSLPFMAGCAEKPQPSETESASAKAAPGRGPQAPNFRLNSLDGETVELSALKGNVVVIDFWATWCYPCRVTLPLMNKVYKQTRGKDVSVFGISTDRVSSLRVKDFAKKNNLEMPILHDRDGTTARAYGIRAIPTTLVIDKNGCIRDKHIGADRLIDKKLLEKVDELLRE